MTKQRAVEHSIENEKRILKGKQSLEKMLKRIEPFKVKTDSIPPSTAGKWRNTANLYD